MIRKERVRTLTGITMDGNFVDIAESIEELSQEEVDRIFISILNAPMEERPYIKFGNALVRIEDFAAFLIS